MTNNSNVAAILALVGSQEPDVVEAELPVPPIGSSEGAQALWYGLLNEYEFNLGELAVLEQVAMAKSHLDEIEADWRRDGSPMTAEGSMGQPVTDPRIQEIRQLRGQYAGLIKQLSIPAEGGDGRRRPGRPTRAESKPGAKWGRTI